MTEDTGGAPGERMGGHTLVVRLDSVGDVLLAGPAIRAVAAGSERVTVLAGARGVAAARLLPGVDRVIEWTAPWIDPEPGPVTAADITTLVDRLAAQRIDRAVIVTSFHQSALPTALVLRMAGIAWIGAYSTDYPGALLDLRVRPPGDLPESERALRLVAQAGFAPPTGDDRRLAVRRQLAAPHPSTPDGAYLVYHPGASVSARRPGDAVAAGHVAALVRAGHRVVVTGGRAERALTSRVSAAGGIDLGGATDLSGLAAVLDGAECVIAPNTGTAHLAAAVGTPVVSLFAPVVPAARWVPHGVPTVLLGDQAAGCADSRAVDCPIPGHPCLDGIAPAAVVAAVDRLTGGACTASTISAGRERER